jgi:hypothetical protein
MANEIYNSTWWGNTIDTASSIGTSTEMIQGQFNLTKIGEEKVVNGDFATDSDWSKGAGWTISGGLANHAGAGGTLIQSLILIIGKTYQISYKASGISGTLAFTGFSESLGQRTLLSGSNTIILTASSTSFGVFSDANATIDNVSVKEVRASSVEAVKCLADAIHRIGIQNIQN